MKNPIRTSKNCAIVSAIFAWFWMIGPVHAQMTLSTTVVDMQPGVADSGDIEVWNEGSERMYVVAEPSEIISPGLPSEERTSNPDPAILGVLVTPQRMVLEPGQRRIIRISAISPRQENDRVYRVTIKPVVGDVSANVSALKVMFGYDTLVILRPPSIVGTVSATREGKKVVFRNNSNTAQEIFDGIQCDTSGKNCIKLSGTRLYAGASWVQDFQYDTFVEYSISAGQDSVRKQF